MTAEEQYFAGLFENRGVTPILKTDKSDSMLANPLDQQRFQCEVAGNSVLGKYAIKFTDVATRYGVKVVDDANLPFKLIKHSKQTPKKIGNRKHGTSSRGSSASSFRSARSSGSRRKTSRNSSKNSRNSRSQSRSRSTSRKSGYSTGRSRSTSRKSSRGRSDPRGHRGRKNLNKGKGKGKGGKHRMNSPHPKKFQKKDKTGKKPVFRVPSRRAHHS
eukprot:TRINITY_DN34770_c0_g1_i1.p1 TRINITY_DN34770_c0_g1~~TRINITY_DN34770_c0_g1_i1.p1  ORF type:complete len:234 (-),score=20.49 TRINITY_DN34770_c0_g1_i1:346-993(-)